MLIRGVITEDVGSVIEYESAEQKNAGPGNHEMGHGACEEHVDQCTEHNNHQAREQEALHEAEITFGKYDIHCQSSKHQRC